MSNLQTQKDTISTGTSMLEVYKSQLEMAAMLVDDPGIKQSGIKTTGQMLVALDFADAYGLRMYEILSGVTFINGNKPIIYGDLALNLVKRNPTFEYMKYHYEGEIDYSDPLKSTIKCVVKAKKNGFDEEIFEYSAQDAMTAGKWAVAGSTNPESRTLFTLDKYGKHVSTSTWAAHPKDMLFFRAFSRAARRYFDTGFAIAHSQQDAHEESSVIKDAEVVEEVSPEGASEVDQVIQDLGDIEAADSEERTNEDISQENMIDNEATEVEFEDVEETDTEEESEEVTDIQLSEASIAMIGKISSATGTPAETISSEVVEIIQAGGSEVDAMKEVRKAYLKKMNDEKAKN